MFLIFSDENLGTYMYSGPSILRPPMGARKYGLILQVVLNMLNKSHLTLKIDLWDQIKQFYYQG